MSSFQTNTSDNDTKADIKRVVKCEPKCELKCEPKSKPKCEAVVTTGTSPAVHQCESCPDLRQQVVKLNEELVKRNTDYESLRTQHEALKTASGKLCKTFDSHKETMDRVLAAFNTPDVAVTAVRTDRQFTDRSLVGPSSGGGSAETLGPIDRFALWGKLQRRFAVRQPNRVIPADIADPPDVDWKHSKAVVEVPQTVKRFGHRFGPRMTTRGSAEGWLHYQRSSFRDVRRLNGKRVVRFYFWKDYSPCCPVCSAVLGAGKCFKEATIRDHSNKRHRVSDGSVANIAFTII